MCRHGRLHGGAETDGGDMSNGTQRLNKLKTRGARPKTQITKHSKTRYPKKKN